MLDIKYIVFSCYPLRSDTSHDGGLVDLFPDSHKSSELYVMVDCQLIHFGFFVQGGTLKETKGKTRFVVHTDASVDMQRFSLIFTLSCP